MKIIGVTGTKGKTTVVYLIYHILKRLGFKVAMISTIKAIIGNDVYDTGLHVTNPEPLVLNELLKKMVDKGIEYVVLEVTSHGLDQERVYGINFDIGVLTNIAKEHLDYHKTFVRYREAKFKLFENSNKVVLNKDDLSYFLFDKKIKGKKKLTYSQYKDADFYGNIGKIDRDRMSFSVKTDGKRYEGQSKLIGTYNLYNILAALSTTRFLSVDIPQAIDALSDFIPPEGHLESIANNKGIDIYIDFAHTQDSLKSLLDFLNKRKKKRLITVFGSAGERDRDKRYQMGKISGKISDISVITAEDPRSEDVISICEQIKRGAIKSGAVKYVKSLKEKKSYVVVPDRMEAIYYAIMGVANRGDTVVVCGKGHEKSMCYGKVEHPWSDRSVVLDIVSVKANKAAVVLAAGWGKRLKSDLPKVLHKIAEKPMLYYTLNSLRRGGYGKIVVVVGYKAKTVIKNLGPSFNYAFQRKRLGTAHAVSKGIQTIGNFKNLLVINGDDSAFYLPKTLSEIYNDHITAKAVLTIAYTIFDDPSDLGRIIKNKDSGEVEIIEDKDTSESEKKVKKINIGLYVFDKLWFMRNVGKINKSSSGEYYITDFVRLANKQKDKVNVYRLKRAGEWFGINTQQQLSLADQKMRKIVKINE